MKPFQLLFLGGTLFFCGAQLQASTCTTVSLRESNDRLTVVTGGKQFTIDRSAKAIAKEFRNIYENLQSDKALDKAFDPNLERLSREIVQPLASELSASNCILFVIQKKHIYYALDLLSLNGQPLFLQKPLAFAFKAGVDTNTAPINSSAKGLLLRDPSTDPQNGAGRAAKLYPSSKLMLMKSTDKSIFKKGSYDFLLISGHGGVTMPWEDQDDADEDAIAFNNDEITAEMLGRLKHKLVYLDSCQLGVSEDFLDASRQAGAKAFLAPIISNEAGNSSTYTIEYFFGALREGKSTMDALYVTRKKLYDQFASRANRKKLLYYAYPFRLYLF